MTENEPGFKAARRYEAWYETGFGQRADAVERRLLSRQLAAFGRTGSLLEIGSGTGHFADLWADAGFEAVGLDLDVGRLSYSRRCRNGFPAICGNALSLPFRDGSFDVVAMVTALEFITPPVAALEEAARVARRGLLIGALNRWSPVAWWRRGRAWWQRGRRPSSYEGAGFFSPRELGRLVRRLREREAVVRWQTSLYPVAWLDAVTALPFGAFVVMSVRFDKEGT